MIKEISNAIAELSKVFGEWKASSERRRMQKAISAGQEYIFANEKTGRYNKMTDKKRLALRSYYRRVFFKYDN